MTVAANYNKYQVYGILKDYYWMIKEIKRIDDELNEIAFNGTAQYGDGAGLPTGKGVVSKALENEVLRRDFKSKRMYDYIQKVSFIQINMHKVTDEKEKVVLDCILDGLSLSAISRHLQINRKQVNRIRDDIVDRLVDEQKGQKGQK